MANRTFRWTLRIAAGFALLVIGFAAGHFLNISRNKQFDYISQQLTQMKQVAALNLMDNSSPIKRLKAVNISMSIPSSDQKVVNALLKTLNQDPNINVRLAAVESLVRHGNNPAARQGLVQSIDKQKSPLVRVALADAMLALQEKNSVKQLNKLLQQKDLQPDVRHKIQHTVNSLNKKI
jgi:HEAT repeat protein